MVIDIRMFHQFANTLIRLDYISIGSLIDNLILSRAAEFDLNSPERPQLNSMTNSINGKGLKTKNKENQPFKV